ncbi:calcitonin gene-related peptide type 1 receptor-like, partial [Nilaparvata lugens]|uniref:calcitonin gene-related peptide type 1 receptor-like n=1 Tax=Nilaparvata lugens TaxID=108931 RepID=UPI00193E7FAE
VTAAGLRATLLLLPLLGLNYLVTPFRPHKGHPWEKYYELTSAITASFQGLCVATLFCFCNGEVIAQIRRRWQYIMFRPRANSYTATTVSKKRSWNGMDPSMNHSQNHDNKRLLFVRSTVCPNTGEDNV